MTVKSKGLILTMLACLAILTITWAAPANAADNRRYECKCKGQNLNKPYASTTCGNGYRGANQGDIFQNLTAAQLSEYLPPDRRTYIDVVPCVYSSVSGYVCTNLATGYHPNCEYMVTQ